MSEGYYETLLDTNAVQTLFFYVDCVQGMGIGINSTVEEIKEEFGKNKNVIEMDSITKGCRIYNYLKFFANNKDYKSTNYISILSLYELQSNYFEKIYYEHLSKCGIPFRVIKKDPFMIQGCMDYENLVISHLRETEETLSENNIIFKYPETESPRYMDETIKEISTIVSNHIAMHSFDLYLYSLGIRLQVDDIVTYDHDLRKYCNKLKTEGGWRKTKDSLIESLKCNVTPFKDLPIELPRGRELTKDGWKDFIKEFGISDEA